jgi:transcriptional regulator with XRE-family HTH domain
MMDRLPPEGLGTRLRRTRVERGLSLRQAAAQTGVTKETLSDLERDRRTPHPPTLAKIARGYGVEISDLLGPVVEEESSVPKEPAPPSPEQLRLNGFLNEERRPSIFEITLIALLREVVAPAAEEWLRIVSDPTTERGRAYALTKRAQTIEDVIATFLGDEADPWAGLSPEGKRTITRVTALTDRIVEQYIARVEELSKQLAEHSEQREAFRKEAERWKAEQAEMRERRAGVA